MNFQLRFASCLASFLLFFGCRCAAAAETRVACVGDSITAGYGLGRPETDAYPAVLQSLLGSEYVVGNFGKSSTTLQVAGDSPYRSTTEFTSSVDFEPDLVVIMLGTNDAKPQNWQPDAFEADYANLIEHYRSSGAQVVVATPPAVIAPGAFDISPSVVNLMIVPLVRQLALDTGAALADVYEATPWSLALLPDTVHPNADGAAQLAATIAQAILAATAVPDPASAGAGPGEDAGGSGGGMPAAPQGGSGGAGSVPPATGGGPSEVPGDNSPAGAGGAPEQANAGAPGLEPAAGSPEAGSLAEAPSGSAAPALPDPAPAAGKTFEGPAGSTSAAGTAPLGQAAGSAMQPSDDAGNDRCEAGPARGGPRGVPLLVLGALGGLAFARRGSKPRD